jgi:alkanesulfonate monooxygenase SsuD/methylene tetrahydromethanopterin reductase-like flavin-dependent oxidoreductase (luciferase family)
MTAITGVSDRTFGLFLNMGANLAPTTAGVFDLTLREADAAEQLGYDELWVTEHHFIRFGINPSALTTAGFLLGRTERIRVGTAVTLSPLLHPVEMAERSALLDQLSGGRFSLGLGRGGYRKDYDVLGVDFARWDDEPASSARQILTHWAPESDLQPAPLTQPHPELLLGTTGAAGLELAARNGLALQHYFAMPAEPRVQIEQAYRSFDPVGDPRHLHTLTVIVDDDPDIRHRLEKVALQSFKDGDHPHVPQAPEFRAGRRRARPVHRDDRRQASRVLRRGHRRRRHHHAHHHRPLRKGDPPALTPPPLQRVHRSCSWLVYTDCVRPSTKEHQ